MNKRKIKVSTAIPASMSDFETTSNAHLTSATLRVFHQGTTQDGRFFTQKFADKLAATIGGTPVVASYDEESDDFIGHDLIQSVFGFVPEDASVWTEEDEQGNSWLSTEVRLFTERHDVGTIAKKIIGHPQSLELDPSSVEVNFVDSGGELPLIEYVDGNLIGLSVLGINQPPAFDGSGFFEASVTESLEELIAKYVSIPKEIVMETGGEDMNKVILFEKDGVTIFKRKNRIYVETQDGSKDDITDAVVETTPEVEGDGDNDGAGDDNKNGDDNGEGQEPEAVNEPVDGEEETPEPEETPTEPENPEDDEGTDEGAEEGGDDFESEEDAESTKEPEKEVGVEPEAEESSANEAALDKAEREELENYRREHKLSIIERDADFLTESQLKEFKDRVDEFDMVELEKELSVAAMANVRKEQTTKPTFGFVPTAGKKNTDDMGDMIRRYNEVK